MVGNGNSVVGGGGGGGDIAGYATQAWVNENYLSIEFFSKLFKAYDSAATPNEIKPNDTESTITNIKAMFGLWTEQYISVLGQSPGGGGGGGTGTVTSITAGTGLSGGTITTMGTIAIDSTYQGYIQHGETAYGWGNHASAGYATPSSVASQMQTYAKIQSGTIIIGDNSITPLTQHQTVDGTFWGQSWSNRGTVSGSINAGSNGGQITGFHSIELNNYGTLSGYGGFIDFHYNGSSNDYTSRIIEDASGRLFLDASVGVRIGSALLSWDNDNNALKIQKIDGTAANFYATGGVSALGITNPDNNPHYITAQRYYLDISRYLFLDNGTLKYNDNGTVKTVAFS